MKTEMQNKISPGEEKANLAENFFRTRLTHTKGQWARKPFLPETWESLIIRDLFGFLKPDGNRQFNTAYLSVPGKNGKTEFGAGLALTGLLVDDEPGAEIFLVSATRDQAFIIFQTAAQMVRNDTVLSESCIIHQSAMKIIKKTERESHIRAVSANSLGLDGINPHMAIFDDAHNLKNQEVWESFRFASLTRIQPLQICLTTAGIPHESVLAEDLYKYAKMVQSGKIIDPCFYSSIYEMVDEDWKLEGEPATADEPATGWYKANPALGRYIPIERVRQEAEFAKQNVANEMQFRRRRLNQWLEPKAYDWKK